MERVRPAGSIVLRPIYEPGFWMLKSSSASSTGFSLIEICISMGIISFALLSVIALIPIGLKGNHDAIDRAFATQSLKTVSIALQNATVDENSRSHFTALAPFNRESPEGILEWKIGGAEFQKTILIDASGIPTGDRAQAVEAIVIALEPPQDFISMGKALIVIVWPVQGLKLPVEWSEGRPHLNKKSKYLEMVVYFAPQE